jgi:nicotinamidase-related amidase
LLDVRDRLDLDPRRLAAVAIDMHRGHLDPAVATMPVRPEQAEAVIAAAERLLAGVRRAGCPVVHVVMHHWRRPDGTPDSMRNPFWRAVEEARQSLSPHAATTVAGHNLPGAVQTEIIPRLGPAPGDHVVRSKHRLSAFFETDLDALLRGLGVRTLLLLGINTNTCVLCSAFEAFNRDYAAVVVSDCVASMYGDDLHAFGLANVQRCLGWVLSSDEVLERLAPGRAADAAGISGA